MPHLGKLMGISMNDECFNRGASAAVSMQPTPAMRPTPVGE
jgi:hypothetical protein